MLIDQQQPLQCFTYVDPQQQQYTRKVIVHKYKSPNFQHQISSQTLSRIELLSHCQKCLNVLQQPITLPCGFTVCHDCLPTSNCISFSCLRTHPVIDYKPTILIENILSNLDNEATIKSLLDCSICLSTLIEPITTQCGHTFCKECLIKTMTDMNSRCCPFCRTELNRIGKLNQLVNDWIDYLYSDTITSDTTLSDYDLPLIQITSTVAFPTQKCLFHTSNDALLKNLNQQKPFAICVFSKQNQHEFYEYGIMLKINHVEYLPDVRHSVVQATGLFRLRINQLTLDLNDNCYTGDITRLDDLISIETTNVQKRWTVPNTITPSTLTTSTSTHKITRPRPCSMRLSTSAPNNFNIMENYNNRRAWGSLLSKPSSPPLLFNTIKKQNKSSSPFTSKSNSSTTNSTSLDNLYHQELHPHIARYLNCMDHPDWTLQYEWYLQQSDKNTLIWWIATILPLEFNEKIILLSMETLRERIMTLIVWVDKLTY